MDPITRFIYATSGGAKGPFDCDFLVIAGGGSQGSGTAWQIGGGGAGGYLTSWDAGGSQYSGGNSTAASPLLLAVNTTYSITVGAAAQYAGSNGSDSIFQGIDSNGVNFLISTTGGGRGGAQSQGYQGGSGGGGGAVHNQGYGGGNPVNGQGNPGGTGQSQNTNSYYCSVYGAGGGYCNPTQNGTAGGGGAGGIGGTSWTGGVGGHGQRSTITGSEVYRASGGHGYSYTNGFPGGYQNINGYQSDGSGGNVNGASAKNGRIYLRYPSRYTLTNPGGGLTFQSGWTGGYTSTTENCTEILSGSGNIQFE